MKRDRLESDIFHVLRDRQKLARVFDHIQDGYMLVDLEGDILLANRALADILGYRVEDLLARNLYRDICGRSDQYAAIEQAIAEHGKAESMELVVCHRDGRTIVMEANVHVVHNEADQPIALEGIVRDVTGHRRVARERERLVAILEATSDVVSTATPDGQIEFMNKAGQEMLGWDLSDPDQHRSIRDAHPRWADDIIEQIGIPTAIREGVWVGEAAVLSAGGQEIPVSQVIMSHKSPDGTVEYLSTIIRDISAGKQTEQALRQSQSILSSAFAALDGMLVVLDHDLHVVLSNWKDHEFVPDQDREGQPYCYEVFKHLDQPCSYCPPLKTFVDGKFRIYEDRNPLDGSYKEISVSPVLDQDGRVAMVIEHVRDVTQRELAEQTLRQYAERLSTLRNIDQAILNARSPDEIADAVVRHIWKLVPCQRAAVILFDFEEQEATLLALYTHQETEIQAGLIRPLDEFDIGQSLRQAEPHIVQDISDLDDPPLTVRKLQEEGIRAYTGVPLITQDQLIGALYLSSDQPGEFTAEQVSIAQEVADSLSIAIQQARLYRRIQSYSAELEERVIRRTVQLEAAIKEMESFSYSVSHDLRAPLRHINGFVQLLIDRISDQLDPLSRHYLDNIVDSSAKMGQLIEDLLAFARTGRSEMRVQPVDSNHLVQDVIRELRPSWHGRHIEWQIDPLPVVEGDPALLHQVWINLLANAIKYTTPRALARIHVGTQKPKLEGEAVFFVRDNGVGFDPHYAHKLFGVFQRLHRQQEFEGTGIGLAIVRRIIRRHGGRVWAEGELERGAVFYFALQTIDT